MKKTNAEVHTIRQFEYTKCDTSIQGFLGFKVPVLI